MPDFDDKDLAIIAVTIIALAVIFTSNDYATIVTAIASGIFGLAVGRAK